MTAEQILNSRNTKSEKMRKLFELGYTRRQVAEMMGVRYGFVQNVFAAAYPELVNNRTFNFNFNRTFGVEIEAYNVNGNTLERALRDAGLEASYESYNHHTRNHWKIVNDVSVSGRNTFELVSPVLKGNDGLEQLNKACEVLNNLGAKINKSCGLHIHFGARDLKLKDWKRLHINYAKLENVIDSFMPNSRKGNNNHYCQSMRKDNFEETINSSTSLREIENKLTRGNRYHKLNTQSYWRQNTVEFRQHSGTTDYNKISNWILFLARLVEYSKRKETGEDFDSLKKFCTEDIINFYENRRASLN